MNDFDEMMVSLDKNLQEVLQRLDKYATEEESLKESLEKLMEDMQGKLDAKTGESIKKYLGKILSPFPGRVSFLMDRGSNI